MNKNNSKDKDLPVELAPCGVYCGACPSFEKTCYGCSSEKSQKRTSKWNCKLRNCCYFEKAISYCFECDEFPCKKYHKKLIDSNPLDSRFNYRHELVENSKVFFKLGLEEYLQYQNKKWKCAICKERVHWYTYKCSSCGAVYENKK